MVYVCPTIHAMTNRTLSTKGDEVTRVSVSLTKKQYDAIAKVATQNGVSVAWVVRQAIDTYIKQTKGK